MPFKSEAQRRKFAQLLVEGKISPETYEEWNRETGARRLPERVSRTRAAPRAPARRVTARKTVGTAPRKATRRKRAARKTTKRN